MHPTSIAWPWYDRRHRRDFSIRLWGEASDFTPANRIAWYSISGAMFLGTARSMPCGSNLQGANRLEKHLRSNVPNATHSSRWGTRIAQSAVSNSPHLKNRTTKPKRPKHQSYLAKSPTRATKSLTHTTTATSSVGPPTTHRDRCEWITASAGDPTNPSGSALNTPATHANVPGLGGNSDPVIPFPKPPTKHSRGSKGVPLRKPWQSSFEVSLGKSTTGSLTTRSGRCPNRATNIFPMSLQTRRFHFEYVIRFHIPASIRLGVP